MRLLLINPEFPESFWSFSWALDRIMPEKRALTTPLGLATLAALCPADWNITIVDENVEPIDWDFEADIVGVCGMGVQFLRQREILSKFRERGCYVVAGGSFASLCPRDYADVADTVISGEAEFIWPQFCADFETGTQRKLYTETEEVDLSLSPIPRNDLIHTKLYHYVGMQFSRGCPFLCEFCDIIVMFGRKPRTKTLQQVERELDSLRMLGVRNVFFVDDNLIGHIPKCKKLLTFLADYQQRHSYRFTFGTEASMNLASDRDLLPLMRGANFEWVFIGIESPSQEALLETRKEQNTRKDMLESIQTIYGHGLDVFAAFIVGFDADDQSIFQRQYQFIVNSGIVLAAVGLLMAIPATPLYTRMTKENRLRPVDEFRTIRNQFATTNIIPLQMTFEEMISGFRDLQSKLVEEQTIYRRITNKFTYLRNASIPFDSANGELKRYIYRFILHGLLPGGPLRWFYFVRSLISAWKNSIKPSIVFMNWIYAISFKHFCLTKILPESERNAKVRFNSASNIAS